MLEISEQEYRLAGEKSVIRNFKQLPSNLSRCTRIMARHTPENDRNATLSG